VLADTQGICYLNGPAWVAIHARSRKGESNDSGGNLCASEHEQRSESGDAA
jgi:hypothetical protein